VFAFTVFVVFTATTRWRSKLYTGMNAQFSPVTLTDFLC